MPMYWTFNCFLGCIYTVYCIVYIVVLVLNWLSNLEFRLPKKEDQVARIGVMGGGFRWFGQCPKENVFFPLTPSLKQSLIKFYRFSKACPKLARKEYFHQTGNPPHLGNVGIKKWSRFVGLGVSKLISRLQKVVVFGCQEVSFQIQIPSLASRKKKLPTH